MTPWETAERDYVWHSILQPSLDIEGGNSGQEYRGEQRDFSVISKEEAELQPKLGDK